MARVAKPTVLARTSGRDETPLSVRESLVYGVILGILLVLVFLYWPDAGAFIYEGF